MLAKHYVPHCFHDCWRAWSWLAPWFYKFPFRHITFCLCDRFFWSMLYIVTGFLKLCGHLSDKKLILVPFQFKLAGPCDFKYDCSGHFMTCRRILKLEVDFCGTSFKNPGVNRFSSVKYLKPQKISFSVFCNFMNASLQWMQMSEFQPELTHHWKAQIVVRILCSLLASLL